MNRLYRKKEWLKRKYIEDGWCQSEIAEFCGVTQSTIYSWMRRHEIPARNMVESHIGKNNGAWVDSPIKDRIWLYQQYITNKKSLRTIAKEGEVSLRTVARWMDNHNITRRTGSSAKVGRQEGDKNSNWKGGASVNHCLNCGRENSYGSDRCRACHTVYIKENPHLHSSYKGVSDITQSLRGHCNNNWRPQIFKRDNYTCRECGDNKGGNLNAHHIVPFVVIRDQLIMEYAPEIEFDTSAGRLEFISRAKKDPRINDLDNGITLCGECHEAEHRRLKGNIDDLIYLYYATVVKVLDADTIRVVVDLGFNLTKNADVRLYGVNAPEITSKNIHKKGMALRGKEIMKTICVPGRKVILRTYRPGKYGRWLALLILESAQVNRFLIKSGLASKYYL